MDSPNYNDEGDGEYYNKVMMSFVIICYQCEALVYDKGFVCFKLIFPLRLLSTVEVG